MFLPLPPPELCHGKEKGELRNLPSFISRYLFQHHSGSINQHISRIVIFIALQNVFTKLGVYLESKYSSLNLGQNESKLVDSYI